MPPLVVLSILLLVPWTLSAAIRSSVESNVTDEAGVHEIDPITLLAFGSLPTPVVDGVTEADIEPVTRWTNGERFRRGLPPLPPNRRYQGTPVRRQEPSPTIYQGSVQVLDTSDTPIGYISTVGYGGTIYQYQTGSSANVLRVHFTAGPTSGNRINIITDNSGLSGAANAPYFGPAAPTGQDTLTTGTTRGARIIGLSTVSNPGSSPVTQSSPTWSTGKRGETAVWSVDIASGALTMQWVQPSGSVVTGLQLFALQNSLVYGDMAAWKTAYPTYTAIAIRLKFIPSA
ncbi:hypothetical protein EXIGLDRAFT_762442 [Exidia glandulosa HHB12029]|uniref:Uncharacterized protein n=1 Tax=Exidia glandulosa HHB12029 TaxID=1314781 RepID=A0A165MPF6_EXIGL|nr:hypothetical protein EXIGLDRAFT_762442 [Exidia glandulosa HHB12029]